MQVTISRSCYVLPLAPGVTLTFYRELGRSQMQSVSGREIQSSDDRNGVAGDTFTHDTFCREFLIDSPSTGAK